MCDVSDYAVGPGLGKCHKKFFHAIYYASKFFNKNRVNYTTEKELLAVIFVLEIFLAYLICLKIVLL